MKTFIILDYGLKYFKDKIINMLKAIKSLNLDSFFKALSTIKKLQSFPFIIIKLKDNSRKKTVLILTLSLVIYSHIGNSN